MSSRQQSEEKEDSSREESFELVTPGDQESRRTARPPDTEESETGTPSVEELQQRADRIRQRFEQGSQEESNPPIARRELTFGSGNQGHQESEESDNQSQEGQGSNLEEGENGDNSSTMSLQANVQGVPTVSKDANDMFMTSSPRDKDLYKEGGCQFPRSERGTTHKEIQKVKEKATAALTLKFRTSSHFVSGKYGEDEGNSSPGANETVDALIDLEFRTAEFKRRTQEYDMLNCLLVPAYKDPEGATPADRWDFTKRVHLFDSFASITRKQVTVWCDDCIRWAKAEVAQFEAQDSQWITELLRNSSTPDLIIQVDRDIQKLQGSMQGGVVWAWIMLNKIVNITDDVATALQERIKEFGNSGLRNIPGENVEKARVEQLTFATRLDEHGLLTKEAVNDAIGGLAKCSHSEFSKMFEDFKTARKLSLNGNTSIAGTPIEQLRVIWDAAEEQYRSFTTSNKWVAATSAFFSGGDRIVCDNCGGNHIAPKCPQPRDEARIARNKEARLARQPPNRNRGGRNGGGRNGGGRGGGGRGRGGRGNSLTGHTGYKKRGKFGPPEKGETVRMIDGQAHAACKICGWTCGSKIHTTGGHDSAFSGDYTLTKTLRMNISRVENASTDICPKAKDKNEEAKEKSSAGDAFAIMGISDALTTMEREEENPEAAMFAAHFGKLFRTYLKG